MPNILTFPLIYKHWGVAGTIFPKFVPFIYIFQTNEKYSIY